MGKRIYNYNWSFFDNDSEELYYFLGFVASDGYITDNEIEIELNEKDIKILEKFRDLICPSKPIYKKTATNSVSLKISGRHHMRRFKDFFNMTSNKKHEEMKFPNVPDEYIKDFIRGYIDGDGCIDTTKGYKGDKVYIGPRLRILGNETFLRNLNEETKKIFNHKTNCISRKGKENVFYITYNFSTAKNILNWIYDGSKIFLERKYNKYMSVR